MWLIVLAALAAQSGEPAGPVAPAATPAPAAAPATAKPAEPKKVCVEEAQVGSHFKKRICATPEEWERRRLQDTAAMSRTGARTPACTGVAC